jgi:hypothetical protein
VVDSGISPTQVTQPLEDTEVPDSTLLESKGPTGKVKALIEKYKVIFTEGGIGQPPDRNLAHTIPTEPGAKPPFRPLYRLSPLEMEEVEKNVKDLLLRGVIEPSTSPYGAPIIFVDKPDGSLRMVQDFRALNKITIPNGYAIPRIDQLMDQLRGAKVFTSLDLQSGYHQIRITAEDAPKKLHFVLPLDITNSRV